MRIRDMLTGAALSFAIIAAPAALAQDQSIATAKDVIFARKIMMDTIGRNMDEIEGMLESSKPVDMTEAREHADLISVMLMSFPHLFPPASNQWTDGAARDQLILFATAYADFMGDPFVRAVFRLVMAERPRFRDVAQQFFDKGRSDFGRPLIAALSRLSERGDLGIDKPSWAAGQLMGMIEHPVFFMPLVTGDEVRATRSNAQIAEDAVETFLARDGTRVQG